MDGVERLLFCESMKIANFLAEKKYDILEDAGCFTYFPKNDVIDVLREYGGTVSRIDTENYKGRFDHYQRSNSVYKTEVDLIIDEAVSDLTLICEIEIDKQRERVTRVEIEDIHVL